MLFLEYVNARDSTFGEILQIEESTSRRLTFRRAYVWRNAWLKIFFCAAAAIVATSSE
jgi:hypothetical protein